MSHAAEGSAICAKSVKHHRPSKVSQWAGVNLISKFEWNIQCDDATGSGWLLHESFETGCSILMKADINGF